ncbi:MAG: U32 family peptidase [Paramuribaculum sp.]|nr:U32 family peptidase [Paramuribaculum sp.]
MNSSHPRKIELLAPARNADIAIEAIKHGADAVYMGATSHGARAAAANTVSDIARVVDYAHEFDAKVYVTLNTIIYNDELAQVETLVHELYRAGVDALIVQDMALLRMNLPPIALHASTQCDIRTVDKAKFLEEVGFSQIVLARELGVDEIRSICGSVSVPVEVFVHGALCVSYSGDCQAGFSTVRRSANRGECPQICRHAFNLYDSDGRLLCGGKHLLSLRDLNRSEDIETLLDAGVSSLKIEGRLKDVAYVKNVTAAYSRKLDEIVAASAGRYVRSSSGRSEVTFEPDLNRSFNRGYTRYFTGARRPDVKMASIDSPKWTGVPVGKVITCNPRCITAKLTTGLANGDGLGYFDGLRQFHGFRLNRIEGNRLYPAVPVDIPSGTSLFRNHDKVREDTLERGTARRVIDIDLTLREIKGGVALDVTDYKGRCITVSADMECDEAKTHQLQHRYDTLTRSGDTVYNIRTVDDRVGDHLFIPRSRLATLRRNAFEAYRRMCAARYEYDSRHKENPEAKYIRDTANYHDNVANDLAVKFYREHGVKTIEPALEVRKRRVEPGTCVMTTRYCLRRELGMCLRKLERVGAGLTDMVLESGNLRLRVKFDCKECQMRLLLDK